MDVTEGSVEVEVPAESEEEIDDDVFYNPNQELNRDLTIAALRAYREREPRAKTYLDAMAATGIRGVRAAADGWTVTLCDRDSDAVELCERNLERNGLEGTVHRRDVNAYMHESVHDVIDVDPFGSPIPFADAAVSSARSLVCVTATDTAPLCGAHFNAGVRRYDAVPRNTDYHREMGLRVLLSALIRTAARYDRAATPILAHATRHYVRTYLELDSGARVADATLDELGYVHHCEDCLHREAERGRIPNVPGAPDDPGTCPVCGSDRLVTAGPLWLGAICNREFVTAVREQVTDNMGEADRIRRLLETLEAELDRPTHYDQHRLCKEWSRPASAMDEFLARLRDAGFDASRAHYSGTAFKTDATVAEMREATDEQ